MPYASPWPKAMAISIFLHIFLLIAAGYLTAGLTANLTPPAEVLLEMDLVNDPADRLGNTPEPNQPDIPLLSSSNTAPAEAVNQVVETAQTVTTSELTMTESQTPVAPEVTSQGNTGNASTSASGSAAPVTGGGSRSGITAPAILSKVDPVYPATARSAGLEGIAVLRIQILPSGRPGEITIERSTGHSVLGEAAVAAVAKWRFVPAKDRSSGKTVACTTTMPVSFRLQ